MENRLYRSENDKKISGVCGGIAEYFGIDSTIVRLIWLISILVYGTGFLLYIIAAIIIPTREETESTINLHKDSDHVYKQKSKTVSKEENRKLLGYGFIIVGLLLLSKRFGFFSLLNFNFLFPIILIGAGILILTNFFKK